MISNQKPKIQEPQKSASQEEQKLKVVSPANTQTESAKQESAKPEAAQQGPLSAEDKEKSKDASAEDTRKA